MKRSHIVPAVGLVVAAQFQTEREPAECKDRSCVNELTATVPDQPHGLDEAISQEPVDYIVVMSSPINIVRRTPEILEWARQHGLDWMDPTPEEISFIRGLEERAEQGKAVSSS